MQAMQRAFERGIGTETDGDGKAAYEPERTDDYRACYLDRVDRCVGSDPLCVTVADDLLAAAVDLAREQDLPRDRPVLDAENERARAFHGRHGFTRWGEVVARDL
ncbi:hypothetical protein ACFQJD_11945 [Haloplanus sp. GCM10025708]|uniref:hypothetical protein n=1 Tax=Haloferacaceae TaxID=1644056 RepID=UPI0036135E04